MKHTELYFKTIPNLKGNQKYINVTDFETYVLKVLWYSIQYCCQMIH